MKWIYKQKKKKTQNKLWSFLLFWVFGFFTSYLDIVIFSWKLFEIYLLCIKFEYYLIFDLLFSSYLLILLPSFLFLSLYLSIYLPISSSIYLSPLYLSFSHYPTMGMSSIKKKIIFDNFFIFLCRNSSC